MTIHTLQPTHEQDWGISCYTYPDSCEATAWKGKRYGNKKGKQREAKSRDEMSAEVTAAAISRARKTVHVKCASIGADHLVTLTYRENMQDLDRCWSDFKKFLRKMRQAGWDQAYVAVGEKQKRGAWHIHIAVSGRQSARLWRELWRDTIGTYENQPGGNIDIQGPKRFQKFGIKTAGQLANYLSKYITKDADQGEIGSRRYRTSINIQINKRVVYVSPSLGTQATLMNLERVYVELTGEFPRQSRQIPDREIFWFASWPDTRQTTKH